MKKFLLVIFFIIYTLSCFAQVKLKDLSSFTGVEPSQLIGYGLVIGLNGTGDGGSSQITTQSLQNMMERFGITVPADKIKPNNVAAVMITATLPAFSKPGTTIDVTVSSVGDARSLEGGTLFMSPLYNRGGQEYAIAQGAVSIGGFNSTTRGNTVRKNYALVGRIPGGATVNKTYYTNIINNSELTLNLHNPDFTTSKLAVEAINKYYNQDLAMAQDAASVAIIVPDSVVANNNVIGFISNIENLEIIPQQKAKVVINERTGTIVAGGNVKISEVAVSHGNLVIEISSNTETDILGQTYTNNQMQATTQQAKVMVMNAPTVNELAAALNRIKVSPRDLISIFQSLKTAGALQAQLIIM